MAASVVGTGSSPSGSQKWRLVARSLPSASQMMAMSSVPSRLKCRLQGVWSVVGCVVIGRFLSRQVMGRSKRAASEMGGFQAEELLGLVADGQAVLVETKRCGLDQVADFLGVPSEVVEGFAEGHLGGVGHVRSPCFRVSGRPLRPFR